jgi:flagellar hook protein FlgE
MSLFGATNAALSGLNASSTAVNVISNNIANLSTTGYKSTSVLFSSLVTGDVGGGVLESTRTNISAQGSIESSDNGTDLAIQGSGFFAVRDDSGSLLYTRAGSFRPDSTGNLVNEAGYILQGWPLDSQGNLPGEGTNPNRTSSQDSDSLVDISTATITGTASPTTQISTKINLRAEEALLEGAGDATNFTGSTENAGIGQNDTIIPTNNMAVGDIFSITTNNTNGGGTDIFTYGGFAESDAITAGIGGATNINTVFTTDFTDGEAFTIDVPNISDFDPVTFTFQSDPNLAANEFSTFSELQQIINDTEGLNARISSTGIMYIAPDDAQDGLTFANVGAGDLLTQLGLDDATDNITPTTNVFASLSNLANLINQTDTVTARITSPSSNSSLNINNIDSTFSIAFSDDLAGNDLLTEFGLGTASIEAVYDPTVAPTGSGTLDQYKSMASGNISPDFSRTLTVFTQLGESLDLRIAFAKIRDTDSEQTWAAELFAANPDDVTSSREDGLLGFGTVSFNGDGTLASVSSGLSGEISIDPSGGATAQLVTLDLGELGTNEGLSQFAGQFAVDELSQDGFPTGRLQSLDIDSEGFVTAIFDNSLTSRVYKLPLVDFPNPNGLTQESGNAYSANSAAGEATLGQVGDASVGTIVPSALEVSTADIGEQLTNLIVAQQAYSAAANVLSKVGELFTALESISR